MKEQEQSVLELSGIPQRSVLGPLLCSLFINLELRVRSHMTTLTGDAKLFRVVRGGIVKSSKRISPSGEMEVKISKETHLPFSLGERWNINTRLT